MSYADLVMLREQTVDEIPNWVWVKEDTGAWDGPSMEWETTHKDAYLTHTIGRDVVVQAGGNCGLYPRLFAKYFRTVYTFEPDPLNFHCLVNNCQMDNIVKINAALGGTNEMVRVERGSMGNVGTHHTVKDQHGFVPQFKIDQLGLTACNLIQLDVESYEMHILRGAVETIEKYKPTISVENSHGDIEALLKDRGYEFKVIVGSDSVYSYIQPESD